MPRHTLGWRIAQKRREKGVRDGRDITQADLAEAVEASPTSVSEWEADKKKPRDRTMARVAAYLGTTEAYLVYGVSGTTSAQAPMVDPMQGKPLTDVQVTHATEVAAGKRRKQTDGAAGSARARKKPNDRRRPA